MRKNKLLLLLALLLTAATGAVAQSTPITTVRSWDFTKGGRNSDWASAQAAATSVWGGPDSSFRYSNANNLSEEELTDGTNPLKGLAGIYFTAPAGSLLLGGKDSSSKCLQTSGNGISILLPDCAAKDRITLRFCASVKEETVTITSDQMKSSYVANSTDRSNEVSAFVKENGNVVLNVPSKVRIYEIKVEPYVAVTNFNLSAETVTVTENKTVTVTATGFSPSNAFDKTLEWTTADENVANVANGVITGVNPGTTTITVTSVDGPSKTIGVTVLPTYSVTMADGTEDADKWTISPNPAPEGSPVTIQYTGRLKVKGVTATSDAAPAAKEPATVTTAPTGAAIVGVGKSTALVSGGAADGGTLMYAVTTTNTKPTSTDGFSDAVPTAQTITASGTVYVWYYVKGDDTHSDSEIAATAIEVPVADVIWDITNISSLAVAGTGDSYEKEGIKLSANAEEVYATWINDGISFSAYQSGGFTFTAPTGKAFTKIEMKALDSDGWATANLGTGWAFNNPTVTWKGSAAASTVGLLTGADNYYSAPVTYIAFYLSAQAAKPAATVSEAPTGAAIVGVGKTTALVSGGVAEGGTLWYAVTTTNTKPASTDGFSGTVPTAQDITASGTVYVWYYVKGDDTHSDSEIAATAIEVPVADIVWDATNVNDLEIWGTEEYEKDGVKLSGNAESITAQWADYGDPATLGIVFEPYESGGYTFTAPTGKAFTKIEMKAQSPAGWYEVNLGDGWTYFGDDTNVIYTVTWKGSAATSTVGLLPDTGDFSGAAPVKSIAFYLVDAE